LLSKSTTQDFGAAYTTGMFIVMNKAKWAALPPDIQKIFTDVSKEYITKQGKVWDEIDKEGYAYSKSKGNKVIALSPAEDARWAAAVKPLLDEQEKSLKSKGLPSDAVKYAVDYLKK
jgi:TRAP-type transport system periplasmic protein